MWLCTLSGVQFCDMIFTLWRLIEILSWPRLSGTYVCTCVLITHKWNEPSARWFILRCCDLSNFFVPWEILLERTVDDDRQKKRNTIKKKSKIRTSVVSPSAAAVYPSSSLRLLTNTNAKHRIIKMFNYLQGFVLRQDDYRTMHYVRPSWRVLDIFHRPGQRHSQTKGGLFPYHFSHICIYILHTYLFNFFNAKH